jgi:hypothetical protein
MTEPMSRANQSDQALNQPRVKYKNCHRQRKRRHTSQRILLEIRINIRTLDPSKETPLHAYIFELQERVLQFNYVTRP